MDRYIDSDVCDPPAANTGCQYGLSIQWSAGEDDPLPEKGRNQTRAGQAERQEHGRGSRQRRTGASVPVVVANELAQELPRAFVLRCYVIHVDGDGRCA